VAESLRERGASVEFIGAESGIESTLVPRAGYKLHSLPLAGFAGGVDDRIRAAFLFMRAVISCRRILENSRPNAVFGVGGYASAPAVIAANTLRIPTFLHEQNSVPGRVNRFASRFTKEVFATFPEAAEHLDGAKTVGMPTRRAFFKTSRDEALSELGLRPPVAFIFGGSGGALKINLAAMEAFREETAYTVVQIAGRRDFSRLSTDNPRHRILEYADDIWKYIAASDVVVSRAGAGSLFDVAAARKAAVFIPYPHATGDHQLHNARYFTEKDAAILLPDSEVTPESIKTSIENLLEDETRRSGLAERIRELATPNAADEIADKLLAAGENDEKRDEDGNGTQRVSSENQEARAGASKNESSKNEGARNEGAKAGHSKDDANREGVKDKGSKSEAARDEHAEDEGVRRDDGHVEDEGSNSKGSRRDDEYGMRRDDEHKGGGS